MKTMTRITMFVLVVLVLLAAVGKANAHHTRTHWQYQYEKWLPPVWQRIAKCETGTNWQHSTQDYQGAFGFYRGSWDQFKYNGYPSEAYLATPWQQYKVALRIHARYGFTGWGCYMNRSWVRYG